MMSGYNAYEKRIAMHPAIKVAMGQDCPSKPMVKAPQMG